jgi:excisionase family DNA binding protein
MESTNVLKYTSLGKPLLLVQVPNQRLFRMKAAARYLGIHQQTLRKLTDQGKVPALNADGKRTYRLEDLNAYIESLPQWYYGAGERSEASNEENNDQ